jgi:hypothetical protein
LVFHQRLSQVNGTFQISGQSKLAGRMKVDLWGDHVRFECIPEGMAYGQFQLMFDGHVQKNTMRGTLAVTERGQNRELAWQAKRGSTDFSGTWQWPCATGERPVKLKIERGVNDIAATYVDQDQAIPVRDIYDCGGGLYFTLLIGHEADGGLRITNDTGWLIGEGILDGGSLKGKIEFYPYKREWNLFDDANKTKAPERGSVTQDVIREWAPHLVHP